MKIRKGFVSNSSSASFLIVGVGHGGDRAAQQAVADEWKEGWGGYHYGKSGLVYLGSDYDYEDDEDRNFQPYYIGVEAHEGLQNGRTFDQLRDEFIEASKELGITWRPNEVELLYGEVSSE